MLDALTVILSVPVMVMAGLLVYQYFEMNKLKKLAQDNLSTKVDNVNLADQIRDMFEVQRELEEQLGLEREKSRNLLSQKKSSETRLGQITEHLVPFLEGCPYDPKSLIFLGNPIDFVSFDYDLGEIVFVEVKSGNSKPSKRQKTIKNIIGSGRVRYAEIRVNEKGVKHKVYGKVTE